MQANAPFYILYIFLMNCLYIIIDQIGIGLVELIIDYYLYVRIRTIFRSVKRSPFLRYTLSLYPNEVNMDNSGHYVVRPPMR